MFLSFKLVISFKLEQH